jgi:hypothetical protein
MTQDQQLLMRQMSYRHDQMEHKANCQDYKKFNGADTVHEFVQSLKLASYESDKVEIEKYNPTRYGYMQLIDLKLNNKQDATVIVHNRFDWMNDGVTLNGYEKIRRQQMLERLKEEDRKIIEISYKRLAALHKVSMTPQEYRTLVVHEVN